MDGLVHSPLVPLQYKTIQDVIVVSNLTKHGRGEVCQQWLLNRIRGLHWVNKGGITWTNHRTFLPSLLRCLTLWGPWQSPFLAYFPIAAGCTYALCATLQFDGCDVLVDLYCSVLIIWMCTHPQFICWHGQMTCWKTQIFSADLGQTCKLSHPAALCNCCPPHIFNSWCCLICSDKTKNLAFNLEYTRDDGTLPTLVSYSACRRFLLPLPWFLLEKVQLIRKRTEQILNLRNAICFEWKRHNARLPAEWCSSICAQYKGRKNSIPIAHHRFEIPISRQIPWISPSEFSPHIFFICFATSSPQISRICSGASPRLGFHIKWEDQGKWRKANPVAKIITSASSSDPFSNLRPVSVISESLLSFLSFIFLSTMSCDAPVSVRSLYPSWFKRTKGIPR